MTTRGHVGIDREGVQAGRGMATAGIVLGWVWIGLIVAYLALAAVISISGSS